MSNYIISSNENTDLEGWELIHPSLVADEHRKSGGFHIVKDDPSYFLIDIHCVFDDITDHQAQGGVVVYRHLLKIFEGRQANLKVIFYSSSLQEDLLKKKPENYILKLLPFLHVTQFSDFEEELGAILATATFARFNNASESLLSGWAFTNRDSIESSRSVAKIDLLGRRLLIVDDEWRDWETTYSNIISSNPKYLFDTLSDSEIKTEYKKLNTASFKLPDLAAYDFIISDLYLWESHETNRFKTEELVNSISGFLLFKQVREIEPAIPVIFHTTSTKFRIFEMLNESGSDGQIAKNTSSAATAEEKEDNYLAFKDKLNAIVGKYGQCWYSDIYQFTKSPGKSWLTSTKKWTNRFGSRKSYSVPVDVQKQVINLLRNLIVSSKRFRTVGQEYLDVFFEGSPIDPLSFTSASMVRTAGLISELIPSHKNPELTLITKLRNHASHSKNYNSFTPMDVLLVLYLFKTLSTADRRTIGTRRFISNQRDLCGEENLSHPVLDFVHYYNNWSDFLPQELQMGLESRIRHLAKEYFQNDWVKASDKYLKQTIIDNISFLQKGPFGVNFANGQFSICLPI